MRGPLIVEDRGFDLTKAEPAIDAAVEAFTEYAQQTPFPKSTQSKYGLLEPAGKAIMELKAGRYDRNSLIGYTLRTQESASKGQIASDSRLATISALARAVDIILQLLNSAPEPFHSKILDRLDYGLYYKLRRKRLEQKEKHVRNGFTF